MKTLRPRALMWRWPLLLTLASGSTLAAQSDFIETGSATACGIMLRMTDRGVEFNSLNRHGSHHIFPPHGRTVIINAGAIFQSREAQLTRGLASVYSEYEALAQKDKDDPVFNEEVIADLKRIDADPRVHGAYVTRRAGRSRRVDGIMRVSIAGYQRDAILIESAKSNGQPEPPTAMLPIEIEYEKLAGNLPAPRIEFGRVYTEPGPYRLRILIDLIGAASHYLETRSPASFGTLRSAPIFAEGGEAQARVYRLMKMQDRYGPEQLDRAGRYILDVAYPMMKQIYDLDQSPYANVGRFQPGVMRKLEALPSFVRSMHLPLQLDLAYYKFFSEDWDGAFELGQKLLGFDPTDPYLARLALETEVWRKFNFKTLAGDQAAAKTFVARFLDGYVGHLQEILGADFAPVPGEHEAAHFRRDLDIAQEVSMLYAALFKTVAGDSKGARSDLDGLGFGLEYQREMALTTLRWVRNNAGFDWFQELDQDIHQMVNPYYHLMRQALVEHKKAPSGRGLHASLANALVGMLSDDQKAQFLRDIDQALR